MPLKKDSKLNQSYKIFGVVALLSLCLIGYQNCGGSSEGVGLYQSRGAGGSKNQDATCIVTAQCVEDENAITLNIGNNNPIEVANTEAIIDVGGTCDTGNYPFSKIYYSILDAGNVTVLGERAAQAVCDERGRFWIQVILPIGYNYTANHVLRLRMVAVSADLATEHENPTNLHIKSVNINPRN